MMFMALCRGCGRAFASENDGYGRECYCSRRCERQFGERTLRRAERVEAAGSREVPRSSFGRGFFGFDGQDY